MRDRFVRMLFGALAACMGLYGTALAAKDLTEVVVGVPTGVSLNFAMFTAASELGYFEEEGLKVRLQEFQGGSVVMLQVTTKAVQIGTGSADPLIVANQPSKQRLPLKFFYNQTREYNWKFVVPPDSPIKSLADLKGKKVGVGALSNSHMPISRMIMRDHGLEAGKDFDFLPIGVGGPGFKALMDGQVAVYNTFTTNLAGFETQPGSPKLRRLPIGDRYVSLFQNGFFAHEDTVRDNPQMLVGFGRAAAKATVFCRVAMEFCIKSFWRAFPNLKPREGNEDENARRLVEAIQGAWDNYLTFPPGKPRIFGSYPDGAWENLVDVIREGGEIASSYDPGSLYTNAIAAKLNDFDSAAVEKQAAGYK